jgi:hypothetical protein
MTTQLRERFEKRYPIPPGLYYDFDHDQDNYIDDAMKGGAAVYNAMWAAYQSGAEDRQDEVDAMRARWETQCRQHSITISLNDKLQQEVDELKRKLGEKRVVELPLSIPLADVNARVMLEHEVMAAAIPVRT